MFGKTGLITIAAVRNALDTIEYSEFASLYTYLCVTQHLRESLRLSKKWVKSYSRNKLMNAMEGDVRCIYTVHGKTAISVLARKNGNGTITIVVYE